MATQPRTSRRVITLGAVTLAASAAFSAVAYGVATGRTRHADRRLLRRAARDSKPSLQHFAAAIDPLGKPYTIIPAAFALDGWLRLQANDARWPAVYHSGIAVRRAASASYLLGKLFDRMLPQPSAPRGQPSPSKVVFPSGHVFGPLAVGLTAAYTLSSAGVIGPGRALLAALSLPVVSAGGKLITERHWPSDLLGGALAGIAVAAANAAWFEHRRLREL